ncbi:MAG: hypothetical protein UHD09_08230, partial [Bifidobacterium sp.]|nr:hypothetical protein [Bifidobacterium sp.]
MRVGEAKVPGGKFVRVTVDAPDARIDGDFFLDPAHAGVLRDAERALGAVAAGKRPIPEDDGVQPRDLVLVDA